MQTAEDWIQKGDALDDEGKRDEAIECFDKAIDLNPNIARAHFLKGYVLSSQGLKDQALCCLDRAIELKPDYDTALNSKADILSSKGLHKEAIEIFDRAISANPKYAIAIHNKGNSQRAIGLSPEALQSYDQALEIKPDYANCYYSKAFTLNGIERYTEVIECLEKLIPLTPNDVRALNLMGNALVKLEKVEESIEYYDRAIQQKPNTPLYYCNRGVGYVKLGQRKEAMQDFVATQKLLDQGVIGDNTDSGNVAYMKETFAPFIELHKITELYDTAVKKLNQNDSTVEHFMTQLKKLQDEKNQVVDEIFKQLDVKAGKSDGTFQAELERLKTEFPRQFKEIEEEPNSKTAEEWVKEGDEFDDQGKSNEAIACFDKAITLNPNLARAHFLKGYVLASKGLKDQALVCLDRAIELKSDYDTALNSKADILSSKGMHKEAIEIFERAIAVNPKYAIAIHNKGNSQRAIGLNQEALQSYDQALELKPDYANCYYSKAYALNELERYWEAIECLEKLLPLTPNDVRALNLMGNCHVKLGKEKESIQFYTKAITQKPNTPLYYCNRGVANKKIGQKKDALQDFLKAKELFDKGVLGENINNANISFIKETLAGIGDLQKQVDESSEVFLQQVDQDKSLLGKIREGINNSLESFKEKLDRDIQKLEVSSEERTKMKEYSAAFLETFTSTYVTTQVVEKGQIQLDTDCAKETLLSAIASFLPFLNSSLSEGTKSLKEFVDGKEFKKNTRKIKSLANDGGELSQLIGQVANEIALNKSKQQQVIQATGQDLRKMAGPQIVKIQKFCDNLDEDIDAFLYTKLYKTPAAMMGHYDANRVIQKWVEGEIVPFDVEAQFVEIVLGEGEVKK